VLGLEQDEYALEQVPINDVVLDVNSVVLHAEREEVENEILQLRHFIVLYKINELFTACFFLNGECWGCVNEPRLIRKPEVLAMRGASRMDMLFL
jgi:hypothetical protein